ncbi:aldehyde-activating protein [Photobacterium sp. GJ3]|uniref:GFA family protein n=1 Tax=Photobacterium sp. GJ3 TaxID=2829502 RepID=UPI001B8CFC5C|nr:aldehyde-activating protein [Photobacterium sp. GJ3]QUJ66647.1 aldehyde-activating protein [Photobacterium sp. GJ3]
MYTGQCHCGNVKLTIARLTETATRCNCSLCSRYATLWGYLTESEVDISVGRYGTEHYSHGDKCIDFHRCGHCGCITHYSTTAKVESDRLAVNYNLFSSTEIASVRVRLFDGAETWQFINE